MLKIFIFYFYMKCSRSAGPSTAVLPASPFKSDQEEALTNSPHGPLSWGVHCLLRMSTTGISDMNWGQVGWRERRGERGRFDSRGSSGGESRLLLMLRAFPGFWKMPPPPIGRAWRMNNAPWHEVLLTCYNSAGLIIFTHSTHFYVASEVMFAKPLALGNATKVPVYTV